MLSGVIGHARSQAREVIYPLMDNYLLLPNPISVNFRNDAANAQFGIRIQEVFRMVVMEFYGFVSQAPNEDILASWVEFKILYGPVSASRNSNKDGVYYS
jgi:hypothetical protein